MGQLSGPFYYLNGPITQLALSNTPTPESAAPSCIQIVIHSVHPQTFFFFLFHTNQFWKTKKKTAPYEACEFIMKLFATLN